MNSLQSSLPLSVRTVSPVTPTIYRGYQYEWGFESLVALDVQPTLPGVFVQGPAVVDSCAQALRFDAQVTGTVSVYLCYRAYSATGVLLDENLQGVLITPGSSIVFPFASTVVRANIASTELSLRFVLRSVDAVVSRYCLQVTLS
jgi:hypothetical protein